MSENYFPEHDKSENIDESCPIVHSDLCYWLSGRTGCPHCYIHSLKSGEQKQEARERWEETVRLLPSNLDALHEGEDCVFCKDEPRKADGYALFEMANPEPYYEKGMFFGFGKKVRTPVGSLVTVEASVCPRCRSAFRMADVIQIMSLVLGVVIGILLLLIPSFSEKMASLFILLPIIFIILTGVAGYYIGKNASMAWLKNRAGKVKLDLSEIQDVAFMLAKGWFFFQVSGGMPRVSFAKKLQYDRILRPKEGPPVVEGEADDSDIPLDNMNI